MSDERGEMTPQQIDELASAYLDGEATAEEAALVESDPGLQALVEELQMVRDLITTPVEAPSEEVRNEMIAQALAHRAPVVSMESARRRLRAIPPQARVILAAAAVVAAIALVGVTLFEQGDRGDDDMMAADDSAPAMADAPADTEEMSMPATAPEPESDEAPAEAAAEEVMDEEMAMDLDDAPMDDGYSSEEAAEPEPMMADDSSAMEAPVEESEDAATELLQFDPADRVFDNEDALVAHVIQMLSEPQDDMDRAEPVDAVNCPQPPDEELELLTLFTAMVEGAEVEVSAYLDADVLTITQMSLPPECETLSTSLVYEWPH